MSSIVVDFNTIYNPEERGPKKLPKVYKNLAFVRDCPSMNEVKLIAAKFGDEKFVKTFKSIYETVCNSFNSQGQRFQHKTCNITLYVDENELKEYTDFLAQEGFIPERVENAFDETSKRARRK